MNAITPFQFENQNVRVVTDERGEPLFVGKDVCIALGYADHTNAMKQHCRGVVKRHPIADSLGRTQEVRVLSEPDVLRLIVSSQLPAAQAFERWVFEEVLPSIRKTGAYVPPQQKARSAALPRAMRDQVASLLMIGKALSKVKGVNEALAMACTLDAIERSTDLPSTLLVKALPSVAPEDAAALNATQIGEQLGMSGRAANTLLEQMGLQYRDEAKNWRLTEAGTAYGEMKPFHKNGHSGYETRWKSAVIEVARRHLDGLKKAA